jgi:hypothetical protein
MTNLGENINSIRITSLWRFITLIMRPLCGKSFFNQNGKSPGNVTSVRITNLRNEIRVQDLPNMKHGYQPIVSHFRLLPPVISWLRIVSAYFSRTLLHLIPPLSHNHEFLPYQMLFQRRRLSNVD